MSAIFLSVEFETSIAQREFPVCLARCDGVGQYATHLVLPVIRNDLLAQIHHTATFGLNASASFCVFLDGFATGFVLYQCFQMLLRITAWQIEQVDIVEARHFLLGVKETNLFEPVYSFLI